MTCFDDFIDFGYFIIVKVPMSLHEWNDLYL